MLRRFPFILALLFSLLATALAQQTSKPAATPEQQKPATEDDVVRITTNLVQVDAVVTDKDGKLVTDLGPEEFEILEDGRQQKITNFSFISIQPAGSSNTVTVSKSAVPPARLKPEQVGRTIIIVVDDLSLPFTSVHYVKRALKNFVDEQVQPGDLVAILRTGSSMGALQQLTNDKLQLYAAIEHFHYNFQSRGGLDVFDPIAREMPTQLDRDVVEKGLRRPSIGVSPTEQRFRQQSSTEASLLALDFIVQSLSKVPGRKSIVLFSAGLPFHFSFDTIDSVSARSSNSNILSRAQKIIDNANRASVVIYTIDPRGLPVLLSATDDLSGRTGPEVLAILKQRSDDINDSLEGLTELAAHTGGLLVRNTNDITGALRRVVDDQKGYYLIGYRPEESTFEARTGRRRFHHLTVHVKRPGLQVRSRTGFLGVADKMTPRTPAEEMYDALVSPFNSNGVRLRLTSTFANTKTRGSYLHTLLHVDTRDLTFTEEPDGWHKADLIIIAMTFGDNGDIADKLDSRKYTLRVRGKTYERIMRDGIVYGVDVPVKKAGAYQLRVSLRDMESKRLGSAGQFIVVPDIGKNQLALSGILMNGSTADAASAANSPAPTILPDEKSDAGTIKEPDKSSDPQLGPAVRRLRPGMMLDYGFVIYNAQLDSSTHRPKLQMQVRLFREGKQVYEGTPLPVNLEQQTDLKRIQTFGRLQLSANMLPGEYALQVTVTDLLAKEQSRTRVQWIDFEIVK